MSSPRWKGVLALLAACGAGSEGARGVPDAGGKTFARLGVVLTMPRDGSVTVGAVGRLLRYRGVDRDSAQVLAGARDRDPSAVGGCAVIDDDSRLDDALATAPPDAAVQMLDAGDLLVRVAGQTLKLAPRYVPDIVPFVSGVVYDTEVQALESAEIGGEAFIAAFGGQQVGRFIAPADLPAAPRLVGDPTGIDAGSDLAVTWTAEATAARGTVSLVVSHDTGPALRCHVADTGRFVIPATALARIIDSARGEGVALAVERSRKTPFSAPGLDAAEVEVTVRDVVSLRVN